MSIGILIFFLALVVWFALDGYRNGLYYSVTRITTVVLVYVFSGTLGKEFVPYVERVDWLPLVVRPHLATLAAGFVILFVGGVLADLIKRKTMKLPKEPTPEEKAAVRRRRLGGLVLGAAVGALIGLILFVILWNIGWLAEETNLRPARERAAAKPGGPINDLELLADPMVRKAIALKRAIEYSVFGKAVQLANPVKTEQYETIRGMLKVVGDPALQTEFRKHPNTQELLQNERIRALLKDEEILRMLKQKDYRGLLDNPKIADLVKDNVILEQFKRANISQVLKDIGARED